MITTTKNVRIPRLLAVIVIAAALFAPLPAQAQAVPVADPATYLIQFHPTVTEAERAAWIINAGAVEVDWMDQINVAEVKFEANPSAIAASAADMTVVSFIEADAVVTGDHTIADPAFLDPIQGYGLLIVKAAAAWNVTAGISTTIVAVVDSGINPTHPEFAGRLVPGYDYVNGDDDPTDDHGHGTHVAGTIAAGIDGVGTVGMCPQCSLMAVKVLNQNNAGTWGLVAKGILFAVDHGARVINLSLGAAVSSPTLESAVAYAEENNVVVVAAAGNSNSNLPFYPAAIPTVIAVSATNKADERWALSNFGDYIDVAAPGDGVYSTYHNFVTTGGYAYMTGTSMASPFVSGLAGLVISRKPDMAAADVAALITGNADDLGTAGKDAYFGYGRINAYRTMVAANDGVEPPPDDPDPYGFGLKNLFLALITVP